VNIVNEGFGSNQLVHLFAQIALAPPMSLIGIEEPEAHLHPKAQSELAKTLLAIAQEENHNFIIATHSEHILYRFLIEVAKGNLDLSQLAIYHFALDSQGTTSVEELAVDKEGRIEKGIPEFFDLDLEEFKELLQSLKA
jgi:predicted ATPase